MDSVSPVINDIPCLAQPTAELKDNLAPEHGFTYRHKARRLLIRLEVVPNTKTTVQNGNKAVHLASGKKACLAYLVNYSPF